MTCTTLVRVQAALCVQLCLAITSHAGDTANPAIIAASLTYDGQTHATSTTHGRWRRCLERMATGGEQVEAGKFGHTELWYPAPLCSSAPNQNSPNANCHRPGCAAAHTDTYFPTSPKPTGVVIHHQCVVIADAQRVGRSSKLLVRGQHVGQAGGGVGDALHICQKWTVGTGALSETQKWQMRRHMQRLLRWLRLPWPLACSPSALRPHQRTALQGCALPGARPQRPCQR